MSEKLWEDTRTCTPRTPAAHIRIGYGRTNAVDGDSEAEKRMERILEALRETPKSETGNNLFTAMIRSVRDEALNDPLLRERVARGSSQAAPCDFKYLLNNMSSARARLTPEDHCTVDVYDPKLRSEACLFDANRDEANYLTSSWDCVTHTGAVGQDQSCYRLCGYDDYCARQVSCAAPDVDLLLCAMGVCLPKPISSVQ